MTKTIIIGIMIAIVATGFATAYATEILLKGTVNLDGNQAKNLGAPTDPNDAATKAYVDSSAIGPSTQAQIDDIQNMINDPETGLAEIKREVQITEDAITNLFDGVQTVVGSNFDDLKSSTHGLIEIKSEVSNIEKNLIPALDQGQNDLGANIASTRDLILDKLNDPMFGLEEIKNEVKNIEQSLLPALSSDVGNVQSTVENLPEPLSDVQTLDVLGAGNNDATSTGPFNVTVCAVDPDQTDTASVSIGRDDGVNSFITLMDFPLGSSPACVHIGGGPNHFIFVDIFDGDNTSQTTITMHSRPSDTSSLMPVS